MQSWIEAFASLASYRQFILWRLMDGAKVSINPATERPHNAHDPAIWMDLQTAAMLAESYQCGIGFSFSQNDPLFFIDIDKAYVNGQWSTVAQHLCQQFAGALIEVSQSGTGIHIIGTGVFPGPHRNKNKEYGLEFYTQERFVALTGFSIQGDARTDHTLALQQFVPAYFERKHGEVSDEWREGPVPEWNGITDDDLLISRMIQARSGGAIFGTRASVYDLWTANVEVLAHVFPDTTGRRQFDWSSADAALCQHLAFWTGKDSGRIDRLFRRSALYREKWEEREDYRKSTVGHAVSLCQQVYTGGRGGSVDLQAAAATMPPPPPPGSVAPGNFELRPGVQLLTADNQIQYFAGCVYVRDLHKIFTPDGSLLDQGPFKAVYGGYQFALDSINDKLVKNAWEAFTESQAVNFPKVHSTCFRPELKAGEIIAEENRNLVNTYVPIVTRSKEGNASRFVEHIKRMLPVERDSQILLNYLAACVQYPGVKFQWMPVLQGIEGNGKSMLIECMEHAVGHRYSHRPNAKELGSSGQKFNAWILQKLFIGIAELHVSERRDVWDAIKPLITDNRIEIQGKGDNQITFDNRANFLSLSNHKNATIKTRRDRRTAVMFCAQQSEEDLVAEGWARWVGNGFTEATRYFPDLYKWLRADGFQIVTHYLRTFSIAEDLNPATYCVRAPYTSSTDQALLVSLGTIEQEIMEAVEENRIGFSNGWISSMALQKLLDEKHIKQLSQNRRKEILLELGYIPHPNLLDGRVNNLIPFEGGKPRLYIKRDHIARQMKEPALIARTYIEAQGIKPSSSIESVASMVKK